MPDQPKPAKPIREMTVKELLAESKRLTKISEELSKRSRSLTERIAQLHRGNK